MYTTSITVFHGSDATPETFDMSRIGTQHDDFMLGRGIYASSDRKAAALYGRNVLTIEASGDVYDFTEDLLEALEVDSLENVSLDSINDVMLSPNWQRHADNISKSYHIGMIRWADAGLDDSSNGAIEYCLYEGSIDNISM